MVVKASITWLVALLQLTSRWRCVTAANRCAALDDPSVQHFDIRIPLMKVPHDSLTTYVCQVIKIPIPLEGDFHAVAFQPLIDNHEIMHHMIVFTCNTPDIPDQFTQPHSCSLADKICPAWMAQWSMGVDGTLCPHAGTGVRFGQSLNSSYLLIQIHWNNAHLTPNMTDSSGMRVFYTSHLRPHDLGHVQVGQQDVIIPPRVTRHAQVGGCSGECTRMMLPHPIHLTQSHLHMHYLGVGGWLEVVRSDGSTIQVAYDDSYDFHHPPVHHLSSPVTVWPGDYIRLTCLFSSKDGVQQRNRTVYFGEGSDGEMCYAFVEYYPVVSGFDQCLQLGSMDYNCPTASNAELRECATSFLSLMASQFIPEIVAVCTHDHKDLCSLQCQHSLNLLHSHHCMQGDVGSYMQRQVLPSIPEWEALTTVRDRFSTLCAASSLK